MSDSLATRASQRADNAAAIETALSRVDDRGMTSITITDELRTKFNVLAPSSVFAQENPAIKPMVSIVSVDPEWFYPIEKKAGAVVKVAADKNALMAISEARGISFPADKNQGSFGVREEFTLTVGERSKTFRFRTYTYSAVGVVRAPDGSLREYPAEVDFDPEVALLEAEMDVNRRVAKWSKKPSEAEVFEMIVDRFSQLVKYAAPMIKSKAQSAVIRTIAHVPQKLSPAEAAKPFLFVTYAYNAESPEAQRALMQNVFGIASPSEVVYGTAEVVEGSFTALPEVEQVADDDEVPREVAYDQVEAEVEEEGEPDWPETVTQPGFAMEPEPEPEDAGEAEVVEDEFLTEEQLAEINELNGYVLPGTNMPGKTLGQVWTENGQGWFDEAKAAAESKEVPVPKALKPMFDKIVRYRDLRIIAEGGK